VKSASDVRGDYPFLLSISPPTRSQVQLAVGLLIALGGAVLITAPFARHELAGTEVLLPAYAAAVLVNELITAALLLALFSVQHSRAVLILAAGYLFSGLMIIPWALTFPGVFTALGVDVGLQSTAALAAVQRLGFPLFVLAYAMTKDREPLKGSAWRAVAGSVAGIVAVACGATWFIFEFGDVLPTLMTDTRRVARLWQYVPAAAVTLYLLSLAILGARRRSMLDLWLMVVLATLLLDIILLSYISAGIRLSVGWWAGRVCGLASSSIVLLVLLSETTVLYARLARSVSAERRARDNRLTAMEALSASIAHEVNQPLASMVTNADAGRRWLEKKRPHLEEARAAFTRIVSDGHRASKVVDGIRTMFTKGTQERARLHLNPLIEDVLRIREIEARLARVSVETRLDPASPVVVGNSVQLQQVVSNLVDNAIDAMRWSTTGQRVLRITSQCLNPGEVLVSVEDTGKGLDPAHGEQIFDPFFTTKTDGMGMGLMFCRATIEAHGGRLRATANVPRGAVFQFSLPIDTIMPRIPEPIR
jgi:signal transduction histidine kinase